MNLELHTKFIQTAAWMFVHLPIIVTRIKDEDKTHSMLFNVHVHSGSEESRSCTVQGTNYTMLYM